MPSNVLLLQGPMGPFFKRLASDLKSSGITHVYKINFNAGDRLYYRGANTVDYKGTPAEWPAFLADRIAEWEIDTIYLFGDTRSYHQGACEVASELSVKVGVFEEGYLRPHFITLEEGGVNDRSLLPNDPDFYRAVELSSKRTTVPIEHSYRRAGWYATFYYIAGWLGRRRYPHYTHHRPFNPYDEAYLWMRAAVRKYRYQLQQRDVLAELTTEYSGKYYLAPLQVHCDGQIRTCAHVTSTAAFVRRVIGSFARYAPADTRLVLKHHPLDRGYSDYTQLIQKLTRRYGVEGRVYYVHDLHLPTLLKHATGTVVVNSTVGLSSLLHNTPVKALGHAVYSMPGMTFQGILDDFWQAPGKIDKTLNQKFRNYLASTCQINGSYYARTTTARNETGMDLSLLMTGAHTLVQVPQTGREEQLLAPGVSGYPAKSCQQPASTTATVVHIPSYTDGRVAALAKHGGSVV